MIRIFIACFILLTHVAFAYEYEKFNIPFTDSELELVHKLQNQETLIASYGGDDNNFILDTIGKDLGFKFKFVPYPSFFEAYTATVKGEAALISNVTYTQDREKELSFSEPVTVEQCHLFSASYNILDNMENLKIGVEKGTIWKKLLEERFPKSIIIEEENEETILEKYKKGDIKAIWANNNWYPRLVMSGLTPKLMNNQIKLIATSIAGTKGQEKLLGIISKYATNSNFSQKQEDNLKAYYRKVDSEYLQSNIKKLGLDMNKVYSVLINDRENPLSYKSNAKFKGLFPDVSKDIAHLIGMKIKVTKDENADIKLPVKVSAEQLQEKYYSDPLVVTNNIIIKNIEYEHLNKYTGVADLLYERLGVVANSSDEEYLSVIFPKKKLYRYKNNADLYMALKRNEIDYASTQQLEFNQYVIQTHDLKLREDPILIPYIRNYYVVEFKDTEEGRNIAKILNIALRLVDIEGLSNKYIKTINYEEYYRDQTNRDYFLFFVLLLILALICMLALKFRTISRRDHLCNTLNRDALYADYTRGIKLNEGLVFLTINALDKINKIYGTKMGDDLLKKFAVSCNEFDSRVYRFGGNKFIIIKSNFDKQSYIDGYVLKLTDLFLHEDKLNISAGILPGMFASDNLDENILMTKMAEEEAKNKAIASVFINEDKYRQYKQVLEFRITLEKAVEDKELFAHFQPITNIDTGEVIAFETLSRWEKNGSMVPVNLFLQEASNLKILSKVDLIAYDCAYSFFKELQNYGFKDINISVNNSEQTLKQIGDGTIELGNIKIPPNMLKVEILEDIAIDIESMEAISKIANSGYKIAIDDFGAGNTSLKYIQDSKFYIVKIDKSLLPDVINKKTTTVITSQVEMLHKLNKLIIVEGVETIEQVEFLKSINVKYIQGYYYSKPMKSSDALDYINSKNKNI